MCFYKARDGQVFATDLKEALMALSGMPPWKRDRLGDD